MEASQIRKDFILTDFCFTIHANLIFINMLEMKFESFKKTGCKVNLCKKTELDVGF